LAAQISPHWPSCPTCASAARHLTAKPSHPHLCRGDQWLSSDVVFGVKASLIASVERGEDAAWRFSFRLRHTPIGARPRPASRELRSRHVECLTIERAHGAQDQGNFQTCQKPQRKRLRKRLPSASNEMGEIGAELLDGSRHSGGGHQTGR
jgi:hypothetical protein